MSDISVSSFLANGSPPVRFMFCKLFPSVVESFSISDTLSSPLKVLGSSKSIKQKEQRALHLLVTK